MSIQTKPWFDVRIVVRFDLRLFGDDQRSQSNSTVLSSRSSPISLNRSLDAKVGDSLSSRGMPEATMIQILVIIHENTTMSEWT